MSQHAEQPGIGLNRNLPPASIFGLILVAVEKRTMVHVLYRAAPTWGLPSYSAASIQVEAYLRLAEVELSAVDCSNAGSSPSGQLPAVEGESGEVLVSRTGSEGEAARSLVEELKDRGIDIDRSLTGQQRAQALAFGALVENKLEPATLFTSWCEWESYSKHIRAVVGADLPFPLSTIVPWTCRRAVQRRFAGRQAEEIYNDAILCYEAVAAHLEKASGSFFLGSQPSSIDALLYSHLVLHLSAPTTAPELRRAVESHAVLRKYVDNLSKRFSFPLPPPPPPSESPQWTARAEAAATRPRKSQAKQMSQQERQHRRRNWLWLGCAAGLLTAYVLFSGQVLAFSVEYEDEEDIED